MSSLDEMAICSNLGNSYQYVFDQKDYLRAVEKISSSNANIKYFGPHNYNLESIIYNLKGV